MAPWFSTARTTRRLRGAISGGGNVVVEGGGTITLSGGNTSPAARWSPAARSRWLKLRPALRGIVNVSRRGTVDLTGLLALPSQNSQATDTGGGA